MRYRQLGRKGWQVSDVGYGMWGMASWSGAEEEESMRALQRGVELGCNFFDTAFAYGAGRSEGMLGRLVRANAGRKLYTATKVPPKNRRWPARDEYPLEDCFPPEHIEEYLHKSLANAGLPSFDLLQLHTWSDRWLADDRWRHKMEDLRSQGLIHAIGISLNRWEPENGVKAVRSGLVDAVQVIYNIFDQNPEDELLPACAEMGVAVIARVPFDEGTLTGTMTKNTRFPADDWRSTYFVPDNLSASIDRVEALKPLVPEGMTLPGMALRFILSNPAVSTVIPGMRRPRHVEANLACSDAGALPPDLLAELRKHRWVRRPTHWSQ